MPTFQYRAKSGPGQAVDGTLEAESRRSALDKLSRQGYFPLSLEERADPSSKRPWQFFQPVSNKELTQWTRQLADLLESGVPLLKALRLVEDQTENASLTRLAQEVFEKVRGGQPLSQALKEFPSVFSRLYVSLIYAGEVGGNLSLTLGRLADFMEQEEDFRSRVQAALAYPLLIAAVGIGTVIFLMVFAVPRLSAMFTDLGQSLPLATRLLTHLSAGLVAYGGWALLSLALAVLLVRQTGRLKSIKAFGSRLLLRVPFWGPVVQKSVIVRFARTLATLLAGGVPIVQALRVIADVLDSPALEEPMRAVARQVEEGRSLSESLKRVPRIPVFICHMIAVGEEVNALEKSLNKVAATYERETDRAMKLATSLLEPFMILFIGSAVGIIVIAMLLPIFQISALVH